jgi:hypothetical protein
LPEASGIIAAMRSSPGRARWRLGDVIDFDYFLAASAESGSAAAVAARLAPAQGADRRALFHAWLVLQREQHPDTATPGEQFERGRRIANTVAWVVGLLLGGGLAGTWLSGGGAEPVNAPLFWAGTVGVQLLLLVAMLLGWVFRRRLGGSAGAVAAVWQRLVRWGGRGLAHALPGERRDELRAWWARVAQREPALRPLIALPAAAATQRFAMAFNLGLLLAMVGLHLPLEDLRFGWQSTYPVSAAQVHAVLRVVAAPWHWMSAAALPTTAQVAATRYVQGQLATTLPAGAAHAWWPFLVASVVVYGLLLRLLMLALLQWAQARHVARLRFDSPAAHALWRRLQGGPFAVQGGAAELPAPATPAAATRSQRGHCIALVEPECDWPDDALTHALQAQLGWSARAVHRLPVDDRLGAAAQLDALKALRPRPDGIAVVVPAARDPIVAVASVLRAVSAAAGDGVPVVVALTRPDAERLGIWQRFVQIHRLGVGVEALQ